MKKYSRDFWRKCLLDPVFFAREILEITPHSGQKEWLLNSTKPENALHTGNRWGKSLVQAVKILHRALFKIRKLKYDSGTYQICNASITQDQANIIFYKVLNLVKKNKALESLVKEVSFSPYPHMEFGNGSVFWSRSTFNHAEHLLGHDFDYINFDEVAFEPFPEYVVEQVMMMRLADREGMLDYISTPKGKNWFYRKCQELKKHPKYGYVQTGDTTENPYVSFEYLARKMKTFSQIKINQNIYGKFVENQNQIIKESDLTLALSQATGLAVPQAGKIYCHGWDLGRKESFTVGITLDISKKPYQLVAFERYQKDWKEVYDSIRRRKKEYGGRVLLDSTGLGDVVLSQLSDIKAEGFNFAGHKKAELLANLEKVFALGEIGSPYVEQISEEGEVWSLLDELRELCWDSKELGDGVGALALALWLVREIEKEKPIILKPRVGKL